MHTSIPIKKTFNQQNKESIQIVQFLDFSKYIIKVSKQKKKYEVR